MHHLKLLFLFAFVPLVLAGCSAFANQTKTENKTQPADAANQPSASEPIVMTATDAKLGTYLTDAKGMTLYVFAKDQPNVSNCYDQCAQNWPPLIAASGDPVAPDGLPGTLGTTVRKDGMAQVTYNRMPLYYWFRDTKPGDTNGHGIGDVWFVVPPATPSAESGGGGSY
ncbi:MAG: hypothetical protein EPO21_22445 [Chloroflexota bacterium]|nr:MAG: hypothetical protein EPO21_22445 [Chloroflexota bacterium]